MVVITSKAKVGEISGQEIWRVTGTHIIPYLEKTSHIKEEQVRKHESFTVVLWQYTLQCSKQSFLYKVQSLDSWNYHVQFSVVCVDHK